MSAAPTSDNEKKTRNRVNLKLRLALRAGGVKDVTDIKSVGQLYIAQPRSPDGHYKLKEHFDTNHTKSQIHAA